MPAQKRRLPSPSSKPRDHAAAPGASTASAGGGGVGEGGGGRLPLPSGGTAKRRLSDPKPQRADDDSDAEDGGGADEDSESSQSDGGNDEFIIVKLAEIRKEVQCPICLGIIRKTRTVMECLHRFCRDCIDKSMRLGNNECPACRTHCASRRSLRDDPNYDALIAALYPDIDKYEEEELAFGEEEKTRNKKIQETIEETFQRQSEAIGKKRSTAKATATAFARKYRRNMRTRGRGKMVAPDIAPTGSDDEDKEEENDNDATRESSSADDHSPDLRQKRGRKKSVSQSSPARTIGSIDHGFEENNELVGGKEILATSPLQGEMLAWGKNGTRSQTRHGSAAGSNGRMAKGGRIGKLVDHLRTTDDMDKEFYLYLVLLPLDGQSIPNLEKPYLSCRPTLSIRHLVQFIALQLSRQVEELEMYTRMDHHHGSVVSKDSSTGEAKLRPFNGLERLREDKLLSELHPSFASSNGDLELLYALKTQG
ncbi:putative E3 ubiquitin-protein ligase RING1a isoform X1 [Phragmites australis]|uniref:putative E3 ubiquitin-protein ligase RING1a isoform X1 n=1 Tax=Phragmites australis TaxID=29695 RepID=UPI002D7830FE|nr:putative E3 ubiquitin-protein ligase RING1a isoform X1 [Phragmites australis]XP_062223699.1 putative E3 ubiquitin-protein ligase RING1a isoform X1 [Phragmites australis]